MRRRELLSEKRYLIHDQDPLFSAEFLNMIADAAVESVKLPPRSPNLMLRTNLSACAFRSA